MLPNYFIYIGVVVQLAAGIGYIRDTLKGQTKPNRVTWFLWFLAPAVAFLAMKSQDVGLESLSTLVISLFPLAVFIASFVNKSAVWKMEKIDVLCGALSLIGLVLWYVTQVGNIAILLSIIADGLAAVPTIIKSIKHPETETASAYIGGLINSGLALLTITTWNFENYGFQLYWFTISTLLAVIIIRGKRRLISKQSSN